MTDLSRIPPHLIEAALALPENASAAPALRKALGGLRALGEELVTRTDEPRLDLPPRRLLRAGEGSGVRQGGGVAQKGSQTPRQPQKRRGVPNKTELRFATEILDPLIRMGEIVRYQFEAVTWHLPDVGIFTPDYFIVLPDNTLWFAEVKGAHVRPQALVRWKAHSAARPWITWTVHQYAQRQWTTLHRRDRAS